MDRAMDQDKTTAGLTRRARAALRRAGEAASAAYPGTGGDEVTAGWHTWPAGGGAIAVWYHFDTRTAPERADRAKEERVGAQARYAAALRAAGLEVDGATGLGWLLAREPRV